MKLEDLLLDEAEAPFPKTRDGKLLVGEVELLHLIAGSACASGVFMLSDGERLGSSASAETPEGTEQ